MGPASSNWINLPYQHLLFKLNDKNNQETIEYSLCPAEGHTWSGRQDIRKQAVQSSQNRSGYFQAGSSQQLPRCSSVFRKIARNIWCMKYTLVYEIDAHCISGLCQALTYPCAGSNGCTLLWWKPDETFRFDSVIWSNDCCPHGRDTLWLLASSVIAGPWLISCHKVLSTCLSPEPTSA